MREKDYPIHNFDHGITSVRSIEFGPYRIRIDAEHIERDLLARNGRTNFGSEFNSDGKLVGKVTNIPATRGAWAQTAVVEDHEMLHAPSVLFPDFSENTGVYDLELILSFLTGRHVLIGKEAEPKFLLRPGASVLHPNFFHFPSIEWDRVAALRDSGANDAVYAVCMGDVSPDVLTMICLNSAALDNLSTRWYNDAGSSRFTKQVRKGIGPAKAVLEKHLLDAGENPAIVEELVAKLPNIYNDSALAKLKAFLTQFEMYPRDADNAVYNRLRLLNIQRNGAVHGAAIRLDPALDVARSYQVATVVASLIRIICRVYITKYLLGIDDGPYGVTAEQKMVLKFFETGKYRNHDVFTESYEEFMVRLTEGWLENGDLPM